MRKPLLADGNGSVMRMHTTKIFKPFLLLFLLFLATNATALAQVLFSEGADLPNTGSGPLYNITAPGTYTVSGGLNTSSDGQDRFEVNVGSGLSLSNVTYNISGGGFQGNINFAGIGQYAGPGAGSGSISLFVGSYPLPAGTYGSIVAANFSTGSSWTMSFVVTGSGTPPSISANPPNRTICAGGNTTFGITASNATSYQWQVNTGSGFSNISNGGVYTNATTSVLTITGATASMSGYTYRAIATGSTSPAATSNAGTLTVNTAPDASVGGSVTNVLCNGAATGSATVAPTGGTTPYTYSWSPSGGTAATASGRTAGTYTVTVTGNNSCSTTRSFTITQPSALVASFGAQTNILCNGGNTGSATVNVTGGTGAYTYSWAPSGGTAATASGLTAGTYTVTVTDANLCQATQSFTITQPSALVASFGSQSNVTCNGANNGSATVNATGGTGAYSYSWAPSGGTAATASGLAPGTYTVTVRDANLCQTTQSFTITQPSALVASFGAQTNILCNGANTGSATVSVTGGTGAYTYSWSPSGGTAATASGLAAGTYTVTVRDANLCQTTQSFTITQPSALVASFGSQTNVACNGANTGSATVSVTGGTGAYTYSWVPSGGTAATASGLSAGTYTVTVTDANTCQTTQSFTITQPAALVASFGSQTNVSCNSGNNGSATVNVTGGTGAYTYSWAPSGGTAATASGLSAGTYTVTVTDANTCQTTQTFTITQPSALVASFGSQTNVSCNGGTNGSATVSVTGGTGAYTYSWAPSGGTAATASGLTAGTYTVTVIDANLCQTSQSFTITQPAAISLFTVTGGGAYCNGGAGVAIGLNGSQTGTNYQLYNGVNPVGAAVPGSGTSISFGNQTAAGTYTVVATNTTTNCQRNMTGSAGVTINPIPDVNTITSQTLCNGAGTTAVNFSGAVIGTAFAWSNNTTSIGLAASGNGNIPSFTATNSSAAPVTATITVTPTANTCVGPTGTFTITVNPTPTVNSIINRTVCNNTFTPDVTFSGATTGTVYNWTNNNTSIGLGASGTGAIPGFTTTNTGTAPVTATITVTPVFAGSCNGTPTTFTITVNPTPVVNAVVNQVVCNGVATNDILFGSATSGASYAWTNNDPSIGLAASGTGDILAFAAINNGIAPVTATISVTATANACSGPVRTFTVTVNPTPTVDAITDQVLCNGSTTNAVNFSGPVSGTSYTWINDNTSIGLAANGNSNIAAFTATNITTATEVATITVTPIANACAGIDEVFTITVNPTPTIDPVTNVTVCNNTSTNRISFSGAVSSTTYSWTNSDASIGIAANGTGDIASFTAINTGSAPVTATIVVTPSANGCPGASTTFTITVYPTPNIDNVADQVLCNGARSTAVTFSGAVSGTSYAWVNNTTSIGLVASGTGDIAAFNVSNSTTAPVTATITATPTANGCVGPDEVFTITVNPVPRVNAVVSQTVCNNDNTATITFSGPVSGTSYAWVNNNNSIGLATNGTGDISSFTATNITTAPVVATITVTPSANLCSGVVRAFTITVNPTPLLTSVLTAPAVCNTTPFNYIPTSATLGTTFAWSRAATAGISNASATGIDDPNETLTNTTTEPVAVTYTYTLSANSCVNTQDVIVMVNPTPKLTSVLVAAPICSSTPFNYTPTSATTGTAFSWSRAAIAGINNLAATGNGNIAETLINTTPAPVTVTYDYTLTANGCSNTQTIAVMVKPTPKLSTPLTDIICSRDEFNYTPASATTGTKFTWARAAVAGITPATSSGINGIKEQLTNGTQQEITVAYVYSLEASGCTNTENLFVTVRPAPIAATIDIKPSEVMCAKTMYQNFGTAAPAPGVAYAWSVSNADIWSQSANKQNILVNFPNAGKATVTLTTITSNTGCTSSSTYTASVGAAPSQQPEVIYYNSRFICLQNNMDTYRWGYDEKSTLDSVIIPNETMQDYKNAAPDFTNRSYWVMTTKNGCMQKSYYNATTGVQGVAVDAENIKVYPNPATDVVNIELTNGIGKDIQLGLHDMAGKLLKTTTFVQGKAQLQVNDMPAGVYMLVVYKEGVKMATSRFIKN